MALAMSSLPVPVSPRISTVVFHLATWRTCSNTRRMAWVWPMTLSKPYWPRTVRRRVSRSSVRAWRSRSTSQDRRTLWPMTLATISRKRARSGSRSRSSEVGWAASIPTMLWPTRMGTPMKGPSLS